MSANSPLKGPEAILISSFFNSNEHCNKIYNNRGFLPSQKMGVGIIIYTKSEENPRLWSDRTVGAP